jgi:hypothetical protein
MTNEIVIGYHAISAGSNTATLGNTSITQTVLRGNFGTITGAYGTSAAGVLGLASGTAPTTSPADAVQMWSGDRNSVAGKASLHLRTEDGTSHVFGDCSGIGTVTPTAWLHIKAGTATAGQAPLKFTDGVLLATAEEGAEELDVGTRWMTPISTQREAVVGAGAVQYTAYQNQQIA